MSLAIRLGLVAVACTALASADSSILSNPACTASVVTWPRSVLVLLPSAQYLRLQGGKLVRCGTYLSEAMVPVMGLIDEGYSVTFATPTGAPGLIDPLSNTSSFFSSSREYSRAFSLWQTVQQRVVAIPDLASEDINEADGVSPMVDGFAALFIPGGHSPMIDLWPSIAVARIVNHFWKTGRIVCALCHGPVVLASTSLLPNSKPYPFAGRNMTVFSKTEEKAVESKWGAKLGFYPEDVLKGLGVNIVQAKPMKAQVVVDGKLLTGQNPASAEPLLAALLQALKAIV